MKGRSGKGRLQRAPGRLMVGLMSGTSADGIDAVLARLREAFGALAAALGALPPRRRPRLARLALPGERGCACEGPRAGELLFDAAAGQGATDRAADRAALDAWLDA